MTAPILPGYGVVESSTGDTPILPGFGALTQDAGAADTEAPTWGVGASLTISQNTHNSYRIAWPDASDNVAVTQYRYTVNIDEQTGLVSSGEGYTDITGRTPGAVDEVTVEAGDAADNWSTALEASVSLQSLKIVPALYNPATGLARTSETGLGVLVLGEKPGASATPTVLAYSATESTDGNGDLEILLNSSGKDPDDIVWLVLVKSDGVPANAGYSVCWPQTVIAE